MPRMAFFRQGDSLPPFMPALPAGAFVWGGVLISPVEVCGLQGSHTRGCELHGRTASKAILKRSFRAVPDVLNSMKEVIDAARQGLVHALDSLQILNLCLADPLRRSKPVQKRFLAPLADAGDLIQRVLAADGC